MWCGCLRLEDTPPYTAGPAGNPELQAASKVKVTSGDHVSEVLEQRYAGDVVDWAKPWPKYKRLETTREGVAFWAKVRQDVGLEFVRKDYLGQMKRSRQPAKHVTWSKSVDQVCKPVTASGEDLTSVTTHKQSLSIWTRMNLTADEIEYYQADRKAWEQGQRLIAEEREVSDDN